MTTITVPITKELQSFIEEELKAGTSESKAHLVRYALGRLQEERALSRLQEAESDIKEHRVYQGDLKKLLKRF
jgi:Arc/MetJ-type ribon-helix-helix transcriptional regulator